MSDTVPEGWEVKPLGKLVDVRSSNIDKKTETSEIPVRLCNYTDVYYNNRITSAIDFMAASAKQREIDRFSLEKGDVIITKDSETPDDIAVPSYVSDDLSGVVCGYHLTLLKPDQDESDGEFLSHLFQLPSVQHYFYILANGITRFGLTADAINEAPLLTPPLPEQQKIAAILSSVDDVIEKTRAQIHKLKDLKTAMMQELLTKGIGHTEFKDSPVGRIPVGWSICSAGEVAVAIMVGVVVKPAQYYVESGVPALRSANVRENGLTMDNLKYFSEDSNEILKKSRLIKGDLLTVRTGYPGTTAVVTDEFEGCNCIDVVITRPSSRIDSDFFCLWVNSDHGKGQVLKAQGGLAQQHFNVSDMKNLTVVVPSLTEQKAIFNAVNSVTKKIALTEKRLTLLLDTKKALMQDLLTGKVRVNVEQEEPVIA
ncbi:Restriction modification system DNA specificity domain [Nitrosococcus oceani ATCC 19707]|uniref:Restriction modification system DNA specificity domain n=2 Tax=Nitrosococcus oceani TaxID=1229 RepID=Q3J746_NITOC|nr:restriction endonuclease subunit S [Nitrosococcus oceani]ABA59350.1 Restriction modification system DNA specificity domain [Nitrosococcus oceani ATCC 19707]KFI18235.1 restriction endonuclease [Nitrosococcus oceani C-27]GEM20082.1 restriction endonuclease [Nitrosococcus oceani]